jgi:DNA-binding SARP family transcriptional activator
MPLVEVKLLGPLEVVVDGRPVELRRKKQRALLALLALRAGEVVSTDRLVNELWGETPPKAAVGSLQNLISELRKLIGVDLLVTKPPGYVLELDRQQVDAHRFEQAVRHGGDLREALALWRGPALADLAFEPFAQSEIQRLEELRTSAKEELYDAELEAGRHSQLVSELEALVAEHPLRERPRGQLMLALYRSGRQADALEVYRQARKAFVEELGIDPSSELQQLEQAILRQDPSVGFEGAARPTAEPDRRRTVTVLFADIVDSTQLGAALDPEVLRVVMSRYFAGVRTIVARHGGVVEKFIGDAAMAVFGLPTLHEDDALRAVRAASELRDTTGDLSAELGEEYGIALKLRIGLNTGEVLVSDSGAGEAFATGKAVILAMRLEQAATPGEILLGESTYAVVEHAVEADPAKSVELGGALGRMPAFRLVAVGEAVRPLGTASLVGRGDELAWLRAAFAGVCAERRSRVVTVLGEAGVGKSRLASELVSGLGAEAVALNGRCVSYGEGATFLPLADVIRQSTSADPWGEIAALLAGDESAGLIADHVTQLIGSADGVASTGEVFWAVRRFLEALALRRPLVMVLEDVHWAEPTLLDLVEYLGTWTADAPLLVVCLARPDLLEQRPGWADPKRTLALTRLGTAEAQALVAELSADDLPDEARARIVEIAEGNPLYLEQLLSFAEDAGPEALASVPPTVEALLAGRIDRLGPMERALLERAAVAGRDFERSAILHLTPPEELAGIDRCLVTLIRRGLVESAGDAFTFHHVLIQEVAHAGITKERRAELHERFATWLEQRGENVEEVAGYHLEQAHRYASELRPRDSELSNLAQRAGEHLAAAGVRAWKGADNAGAVNLLGRAARLLRRPSARAETLCELGTAQRFSDFEAADATLSEALACAREAGDRRIELRAQIELLHLRLFSDREADPADLVELIHAAIPVFEEHEDERALARAWRNYGYVRGSLEGRCADWLDAAERAATYYRRTGWSPAGCFLEAAAAMFYGPMPVPAALVRCKELLDQATDRLGTGQALVYVAGAHALSEQYDEAFALLDEADQIFTELGEDYVRADNSGRIRGLAHLLAGDLEAAEACLRESFVVHERIGDKPGLSSVAAQLGEVAYLQGRLDDAEEWSRIAGDCAPAGDKIAQVNWRSLTGKVHAAQGAVDEGETLVLDALALVETTDALSHRGAVHLDVASVLSSAGRHREAARRIEKALELFEAKENLACVRLAEARLEEAALA